MRKRHLRHNSDARWPRSHRHLLASDLDRKMSILDALHIVFGETGDQRYKADADARKNRSKGVGVHQLVCQCVKNAKRLIAWMEPTWDRKRTMF